MMPSNSLRESEGGKLPFLPGIWQASPVECQCTWVYAPQTSPYGTKFPWGLKFKSLLCPLKHEKTLRDTPLVTPGDM